MSTRVIPVWASRLILGGAAALALWFLVEAGRASFEAGRNGKSRPAESLTGNGVLTTKVSANAGQALFGNPLEKPTIPAKTVLVIEGGDGYYTDGQK